MAEQNQPVHEIKLGRIRASIWLNRSDGGNSWYSSAISRSYREGDQWREASSFGRDDLPLVSKAAELAYQWIWTATEKGRSNDS